MKERISKILKIILTMGMMFSVVYVSMPEVYGETITVDEDTFPDTNFREYIIDTYGEEVDSDDLAAETILYLDSLGIEDLTGIEYFTGLTYLSVNSNSLTELDVSTNTELTTLQCSSNNLSSLDVSNNTKLEILICANNSLSELDVSNNIYLNNLDCQINNISSLNIENLSDLDYLNCDYLDDLSELDVSSNVNLTTLHCQMGNLSSLDVTNNVKLETLYCGYNDIDELDLSNNVDLTYLNCVSCSLESLDLSQNTLLETAECGYCGIENLTVSSSVVDLECSGNCITSLDLSLNDNLTTLYCSGNQLAAISLSDEVTDLKCELSNQTITIDNLSQASYDLLDYDSTLEADRINDLTGATLDGTTLIDFTDGGTVSYNYEAGSTDAYLEVEFYLSGYPDLSITTQPSDVSVVEGEDATFEIEAEGGSMSTTTYQWYYATSSSDSGIEITDATSNSYTLTPDTSYDGYYYYCVVTNGSETVTSDRAILTVTESDISITGVTLDSSSLTLEIDGTSTLTATISPSDTTDDTTLIWTSSDTSVATVDSSGKVTAINAGSATITVETSNGCTAVCEVTVNKRNISDCTISVMGSFTYNMSSQVATVTVEYDSTTLTEDTDYTLTYKNNIDAGIATVTITGIGNYSGSLNKSYTIAKKDVSDLTYSSISSQTYTGKAIKPSVTVKFDGTKLTKDTDYTLSYKNNTDAGTATVTIKGKGNYTGSVNKSYTISKKNLSGLAYSSLSSQTYTGKAIKPSVTVKYGNTVLKSGTDYTVSYSSNTNVGTAKVKLTGQGNYTGTKTLSFKIKARSISNLSYSSVSKKVYTGKAIKPSITVKYNGTNLKKDTDYKVSYSNNKSTGKATIKITGKGNYNGTRKIYFYIVPKKVTISSTSSTKDSITIKWKKATGASGYQVAYSTSKNKDFKTVNVGSSTLSRKLKSLSSSQTYYVKVRAYKTVNGQKHYGSYSLVKTIKTKVDKETGQKIANLALTKLGCKYVKGGSGPKTFDSAGLVVYCHKQAGVKTKIRQNVTEIAKLGTSVSKSDILPGDTVIFKNNMVGIYVGNNQVIVASSRPKAKVQRTSLDGYSKIRRLY